MKSAILFGDKECLAMWLSSRRAINKCLADDNRNGLWYGETLKYLYLLFANDKDFDPRNVVFNTEAHPLRQTW